MQAANEAQVLQAAILEAKSDEREREFQREERKHRQEERAERWEERRAEAQAARMHAAEMARQERERAEHEREERAQERAEVRAALKLQNEMMMTLLNHLLHRPPGPRQPVGAVPDGASDGDEDEQ